MKRGANHAAITSDVTDFRSKGVTKASDLDDHRVESSHKGASDGSHLDVQQAQLLLLHVRALNAQFASWVQSQLQNHLDELWIDGVQDYLSHAYNILAEFKDTVDWQRENAAKLQSNLFKSSASEQGNPTCPTKFMLSNPDMPPSFSQPQSISQPSPVSPGNKDNSISLSKSIEANLNSHENQATSKLDMLPVSFSQTPSPLFSSQSRLSSNINNGLSEASSSSFPLMQNSSLFSSSQGGGFFSTVGTQSPAFPGSQTLPQKVEILDDADEGELERPSSPSFKKTEEKGVSIVHEVKCKVYIKDNPTETSWKDIGTGNLSIKCKEGAPKATKESKPTIIVRNDVGRILLNALIYPGIKMSIQKTSIVSIFHTAGDSNQVVARTYLLRLKSLEETSKLAETIKEYCPSA